jgi:hypothetical protein
MALILDAYDAVGAAAKQAESAVRRVDVLGRWMSLVKAVRAGSGSSAGVAKDLR